MKNAILSALLKTGLLLFSITPAFTQSVLSIDIQKEVRRKNVNAINREINFIKEKGYEGIRLNETLEDGIVWLKNVEFEKGVLELDVRGKDYKNHSFVGVAFHGTDTTIFECVYLRPFHFNQQQNPQKGRMIQYIARPAYTWQVFRAEFPGRYENSITPPPDPNSWVHLRIVVSDSTITVFINGNSSPGLAVESRGQRKTGSVGFYAADTSGGDFANLKITKMD